MLGLLELFVVIISELHKPSKPKGKGFLHEIFVKRRQNMQKYFVFLFLLGSYPTYEEWKLSNS